MKKQGVQIPKTEAPELTAGDPFADRSVDRRRVTCSSALAPMVTTYVTLSQLTEALRRADFGVLAINAGDSKICRHYWVAEVMIADNPALPATQLLGLKLVCPDCFPLKPEGGSFEAAHITRRKGP